MFFSEQFLSILITLSLVLISVAVVVLLTLLFRDIKSKKLW